MLVVPAGSGNDFAKSLGIRSQGIALRAWKQFCAEGAEGAEERTSGRSTWEWSGPVACRKATRETTKYFSAA